MPKSVTLFSAAMLAVIPLALSACGSSDDSSSTTAASSTTSTEAGSSTTAAGGGGAETVDISETEYKIDPSDPTVKAGSVTFDVTNDGATTHNLTIEGNGVEDEATDDISPGSTGDVTVDLQPGTYEMYCSIDGHKDLGMEGSITVQ